jgi:hypothetical protein
VRTESAPDDADAGKYEPGAPRAQQFRNPVHCVRISRDGLVYVCDRVNNRFQIFRKDGTFVTEYVLEQNTRFVGSVWDIALSEDPGQKYLYIADGTNNEIHILLRETGKKLGSFGRQGRYAGEFHWVHAIAIDSRGNLFSGEVDTGKRYRNSRGSSAVRIRLRFQAGTTSTNRRRCSTRWRRRRTSTSPTAASG